MPDLEIELNPVDFITVGTIGPKGRRVFHLQAGQGSRLVSLTIEKEQAWALGEAIAELMDDLDKRYGEHTEIEIQSMDMDLREPIEPLFRVSQMGLSYHEDLRLVILEAQELIAPTEENIEPSRARLWCTREQMQALGLQAMDLVSSGRPDSKQNGRLIYYWT